MKHYLLLAGLFACVLSASAQKVGTKPNVINQGINPMTQTDNRGKFINEQRVRDMQHDNLMADKHKPSRSIVVNNEQWRNTKTVVKDANGNVLTDGDTVTVIKDLKIKGSSQAVKGGTKVKNIRLTDGADGHNIACKIPGFGAMNLKSEFVKKA